MTLLNLRFFLDRFPLDEPMNRSQDMETMAVEILAVHHHASVRTSAHLSRTFGKSQPLWAPRSAGKPDYGPPAA